MQHCSGNQYKICSLRWSRQGVFYEQRRTIYCWKGKSSSWCYSWFLFSNFTLNSTMQVPNHMQDTKSHLGARFCHKFKVSISNIPAWTCNYLIELWPLFEFAFVLPLQPLLCTEFIDESTLFVVERPLQDIWEQLPPTLYQKKFGT